MGAVTIEKRYEFEQLLVMNNRIMSDLESGLRKVGSRAARSWRFSSLTGIKGPTRGKPHVPT